MGDVGGSASPCPGQARAGVWPRMGECPRPAPGLASPGRGLQDGLVGGAEPSASQGQSEHGDPRRGRSAGTHGGMRMRTDSTASAATAGRFPRVSHHVWLKPLDQDAPRGRITLRGPQSGSRCLPKGHRVSPGLSPSVDTPAQLQSHRCVPLP